MTLKLITSMFFNSRNIHKTLIFLQLKTTFPFGYFEF